MKTLTLLGQQEIALGTVEFTFQKPDDFNFIAGQNINLKVPELKFEDPKGPRRTFTIASSPDEMVVRIATRISQSGYKQTLIQSVPGSMFEYIGPQGKFVYDETVTRAIYLAGGIGITPFRSMLSHASTLEKCGPVALLYGNARPETSAYHDLFLEYEKKLAVFKYVPTMTEMGEDQSWAGERRWLSADLAFEYVPEWQEAIFFLCGPPKMVEILTEQLKSKGIAAERIRSESLWGY